MLIVSRAMSRPAWNLVLPISTMLANATVGSKVTYNHLIEQTMTIVRSCSMSDPDDALLLAGDYEDFFEQPLIADLPLALVSESKSTAFELFTLNRYSFAVFKQFSSLHLLWKLKQFILVASSQPTLRLLLQRIKDSTWANFNGFHILIDRKTEAHGCVNAYEFLWTAWQYDRLSTVFLCIDPDQGLLLYTYNPYSSTAPNVWREDARFEGRGGHPWILLKRKYPYGSRICEDLQFDKTANLNGYEVRLNAISFAPHLRIDPTKRGLNRFAGDNGEIVKIVFEKLNASLMVQVYNGTVYDLGGIDRHGNMVGMLADVANGEVDMGMNGRSLHAMWKVEYTYPHGQDGFCVITQEAGEIPEYMKLLSFMSPAVIVGHMVVFAIALYVLTRYEGFLPAILNMIRLITSVAMHRLPRTVSSRIFFSSLFMLFFVVNALVQSNLASLLTVPVSRPNIRTSEDLKNFNCQIYGSVFYEHELQDPELRSRFHQDTYEGCKQRVLESQRAACLGDCLHLYLRIEHEPLHRSKRVQQNVQVYVTRENWPLFNRVTKLIRGTVEAGLVNMWKKLNTRSMCSSWQRKRLERNRSFRILEIRHVSFSFYILAIGYSCAAAVFLAEIIVAKQRNFISAIPVSNCGLDSSNER